MTMTSTNYTTPRFTAKVGWRKWISSSFSQNNLRAMKYTRGKWKHYYHNSQSPSPSHICVESTLTMVITDAMIRKGSHVFRNPQKLKITTITKYEYLNFKTANSYHIQVKSITICDQNGHNWFGKYKWHYIQKTNFIIEMWGHELQRFIPAYSMNLH